MRKILLLLAFFVSEGLAQSDSKIGTAPADLQFSRIIHYKDTSAKLSDFKSKVVILDFWATWCSPCIESLPHLEKLQEKFREDLQIITITDDPEERIKKFLTKRPIRLPIVIDTKRKSAIHFPHNSIPHTIVIDKHGVIRAVTTSSKVTEEVVRRVIADEPIFLKEERHVIGFDPAKPLSGTENIIYQVTVTPFIDGLGSLSNSTGGRGGYANRRIVAINLSAKTLFEIAYQFSYLRTVVEVRNTNDIEWTKLMCFDLIVPEDIGDRRFKIMQQQLDLLYDYSARIEERIRPVKILRIIPGQKARLSISTNGEKTSSYSGRGLSMQNSGIDVLADFLESQLNKPVVDRTGLSGRYDVDLKWYNEDPNQIHSALKDLGLELYDDDLAIDVLIISDK